MKYCSNSQYSNSVLPGGWRATGKLILAVIVSLIGTQCARAADIVWTNASSSNWSTAANWSPNQVPGSSDTAWITNNGTYTVTLNSGVTLAGLQLGGDSGTQTLNHTANTLTLNGPGGGTTNAVYNLAGGTLTGPGSLTLAGPMNWTGGTMSGTGKTIIASTGSLESEWHRFPHLESGLAERRHGHLDGGGSAPQWRHDQQQRQFHGQCQRDARLSGRERGQCLQQRRHLHPARRGLTTLLCVEQRR